jgi:hypothetical protein
MPIDLIDIPAAVADYLDNQVRTVVSPVIGKRSGQASLTPGQDGTFTVTVTNRGMPDGVRLINVAYHVKISDEAIAQLIVPDAAVAACYDTLAATTPLEPGSRRSALFLRLLAGSTLDVGESQPVQIEVHCQDAGDAKITCHVHADIDASDLFPTSQNPNGEQTVSVIRGVL